MMTTNTGVEVQVVAETSGTGRYDRPYDHRLVRRGDSYYLVHDEFCGMAQMRGGMYRPRVYAVPADLADRVAHHIEHWSEYDGVLSDDGEWASERWAHPTTHGAALYDVLPDLACLGEIGDRPWTAGL